MRSDKESSRTVQFRGKKVNERVKGISTDVINSDIAQKFLVDEATKHDDLRISDVNSRVATETPEE